MSDKTVTITIAEYEMLKYDQKVLNALYAGGVDNWEWYGEALSELNEEDD